MAYPQPPQPPPGYPQPPQGYPPQPPQMVGPPPAKPTRRTRTKPLNYQDIPIPDKLAHRKPGTVKATIVVICTIVVLSLANASLPSVFAGEFTPSTGAIIFASGAVLLGGGSVLFMQRRNWARLVMAGFLVLYMPAAVVSIALGKMDETLQFIEVLTIFAQLGVTAGGVGLLLSSNVARWSKPGVNPHSRKPFPTVTAFPATPAPVVPDPPTAPLRISNPTPVSNDPPAVEDTGTMALRVTKNPDSESANQEDPATTALAPVSSRPSFPPPAPPMQPPQN